MNGATDSHNGSTLAIRQFAQHTFVEQGEVTIGRAERILHIVSKSAEKTAAAVSYSFKLRLTIFSELSCGMLAVKQTLTLHRERSETAAETCHEERGTKAQENQSASE